jgi:glycosyltransferase involved in cell wall biosynthesis
VTPLPTIAVVVPAFNERRQIALVVGQLLPRCSRCIVVDDGSSDGTADAAAAAGAVVLRHMVNRGQGAATLTGIRYALLDGPDVIVSFDADGQHDAEDLPALVAPILAGRADIALGSRFLGRTEGMPRSRRLLLRGGILFTRAFSGIRVTDVHNGLRAWSRNAAGQLTITLDGMAHASEILDQIRTHRWRFVEVPSTIRYSEYSLRKGQSAFNSIRIVAELIMQRLGR